MATPILSPSFFGAQVCLRHARAFIAENKDQQPRSWIRFCLVNGGWGAAAADAVLAECYSDAVPCTI